MKRILASLCIALLSLPVYADSFKAVKPRTVFIAEQIDDSAGTIASKIDKLSRQSKESIEVVISSPGGSVFHGLKIVSAIKLAKKRGVEVKCVVVDLAASMAMMILDNCSKRYALEDASLLWHDPFISSGFGAALRADNLEEGAAQLHQFDRYMKQLKDNLKIDEKTFELYRKGEVGVIAANLKELAPHYIDIVDDIEGVSDIFELKNPYKKEDDFLKKLFGG